MRHFLILLTLTFLTACSSTDVRRDSKVDLHQYKRFYVEHRLNDNNGVDAMIAADLKQRGFDATYGHLTMMPDDAQILITYDARWTWDFHSYLIDLEISAKHAKTRNLIATGSTHHAGITKKRPEKMIHAIFKKFFP